MPHSQDEIAIDRFRGCRPRALASHSASPEAAMPTATLATTISGACDMCALACSALMPM